MGIQGGLDLGPIDERVLELLERRLEEKVTERVETTLKRRYTVIAVTFSAALTVAGIAWHEIVSTAVKSVEDTARRQIDEKIKDLSRAAEDVSRRVDVTFGVAEDLAKRGAQVVDTANKKIAEVGPTIDSINALEQRQKDLDTRTKDLIVAVGAQPVAKSLSDLGTKLAAVGEQVDRLSQIVAKLPSAGSLTARDGATAATVQTDVANIAQQTGEQARKSVEAQSWPTLFIQFAGGPRDQAEGVAAKLRAAGYNVPPVDREPGANNQHEVRFFNEGDADAAEKLAVATTKALADIGYRGLTVQKADATKFRGTKPRPGVFELWIELPALPARS